MKKVLVIAYYFPPLGWSGVQRTLKFVKYLKNFGWEPIVLTVGKSPFQIKDHSLSQDIPEDIQIIRVDDTKLKIQTDIMQEELFKQVESCMSILSKSTLDKHQKKIDALFKEIRDLVLIPDGTMLWADKIVRNIEELIKIDEVDLVFSTSSPYSAHLIGRYVKKHYHIPWIADFRDEWSNNPYIKCENDFKREVELEMEECIVNECDALVTISNRAVKNFVDYFKLNPKKVECITNGYDEEDFRELPLVQEKKNFSIMYNGTFYLSINPYTIIEAINQLIEEGINKETITLEIIGTVEESIKSEIEKRDIFKIVKFIPYMKHIESLNYIQSAQMLLLIIGQGEKVKSVYTGKVFEYLKMRKPILALAPKDGVVDKLLIETATGICVEYDDIGAIKEVITDKYFRWKDKKVDNLCGNEMINNYERKVLTKKLVRIFDEIIKET